MIEDSHSISSDFKAAAMMLDKFTINNMMAMDVIDRVRILEE